MTRATQGGVDRVERALKRLNKLCKEEGVFIFLANDVAHVMDFDDDEGHPTTPGLDGGMDPDAVRASVILNHSMGGDW